MEKEYEYTVPEFKVIKYENNDVIKTSAENIVPPWGGEEVTNPEFPEIGS